MHMGEAIEDGKQDHRPHRLRRLQMTWSSRGRPIFFITICTADRRRWLDTPEVHEAFRLFCERSPTQAGVWVGRYVQMPDHIHVFVSAEGSSQLSRWVHSLKGFLATVRRKVAREGRAWQKGFFDHVLRGHESYSEKWAYVRMNPVRAGLVKTADEWPFAGEIEVLRW